MTIERFEIHYNYKQTDTEIEYIGRTIEESEIYYEYVQNNTDYTGRTIEDSEVYYEYAQNNADYTGDTIEDLNDQALESAMKCQEHCERDDRCSFWTYLHHNYRGANMCHLKEEKKTWMDKRNATSGPKLCRK